MQGVRVRRLVLPNEELFSAVAELLAEGLRVRFTVSGNSMWPLIRHNVDSVLLAKAEAPVRPGDIVLARVGEDPFRYRLHRVMRVEGDSLVTAGDAWVAFDCAFNISRVVGRVETVYRGTRVIACGSRGWRLLFLLWRLLFPLRPPFLNALAWYSRTKARLKKARAIKREVSKNDRTAL